MVELWRDQPNNLSLLWDFFTTSHSTPAVRPGAQGRRQRLDHHAVRLPRLRADVAPAATPSSAIGGRPHGDRAGRRRHPRVRRRQPLSAGPGRQQPCSGSCSASSRCPGPPGRSTSTSPCGWRTYRWASCSPSAWPSWPRPIGRPSAGDRATAGRRPRAPPTRGAGVRPCRRRCASSPPSWPRALTVQSDLRMGPVSKTTTGAGPWPVANAGSRGKARARSLDDTAALTKAAESVLRPDGPVGRTSPSGRRRSGPTWPGWSSSSTSAASRARSSPASGSWTG